MRALNRLLVLLSQFDFEVGLLSFHCGGGGGGLCAQGWL
jgi:hypothetical protein